MTMLFEHSLSVFFELQVGSKWLVAMGLLGGVSFKVRHL